MPRQEVFVLAAAVLSIAGAFYTFVIITMAITGFILAGQTRGARALHLLGIDPHDAVYGGRVAVTGRESILSRLYAFSLFLGLLLFYLSIPFVLVALVTFTAAVVLFLLKARRLQLRLLWFVFFLGGGVIWSVLKTVFTGAGIATFGLKADRLRCPQLFGVLDDVARKVDTTPVDDVFIAPGASIAVQQTGRGPFGIFGVKNRTLTLGLSSLHFLTIGELQAILAHEYAPFSRKDTFVSRFIYQAQNSIENALSGIRESGGWVNYVNPIYGFFRLYDSSYRLLAAGYSRSRELLADRTAASYYGSDVLESGLRKIATDGKWLEQAIYDNVGSLSESDESLENMYEAFWDDPGDGARLAELDAALLHEKSSLFASRPTFAERIDALAGVSKAMSTENGSAMQLFDDPQPWEVELTEYMIAFVDHMRNAQAAAAE